MAEDPNRKTGVSITPTRTGQTMVGPAPMRSATQVGPSPLAARTGGTTIGPAPTRPASTRPPSFYRSGGGSSVGRDPRLAVVIPVKYKYASFTDFVETQSANISRTGMYISCPEPLPVGTGLDFEFALADGFALLKGKAEVVRTSQIPPVGMGVRWKSLDDQSRELIDRIIEVNSKEGKQPTVAMDFADDPAKSAAGAGPTPSAGGIVFTGRDLSIQISTVTVGYFVYNPLLNIRLGGFVIPSPEEIALGTVLGVTITDFTGNVLFAGKGKVVAKHDMRLGIRLVEIDKGRLIRLQAEIAKLSPTK